MVEEKTTDMDEEKIKNIIGNWIKARAVLDAEIIGQHVVDMSEHEIIYCLNRTIEDLNKWKMSDKIRDERMNQYKPNPITDMPTVKQEEFMKKHNISYDKKTTKQEASKLIEQEINSWNTDGGYLG